MLDLLDTGPRVAPKLCLFLMILDWALTLSQCSADEFTASVLTNCVQVLARTNDPDHLCGSFPGLSMAWVVFIVLERPRACITSIVLRQSVVKDFGRMWAGNFTQTWTA